VSLAHFKVVIVPKLGMFPIPDAFRPYLANIPNMITFKTTTGCQWDIKIKNVNEKAYRTGGS
jgi:hypothetical protein